MATRDTHIPSIDAPFPMAFEESDTERNVHVNAVAFVETLAAAAPAPFLPYFNSKRPDVLLRM